MGLAGIASTGGAFFNKVYGTDIENITSKNDKNPVKEIIKLSESPDFTGTVLEVDNHEKNEKVIISLEQ